MFAVAVSLSAVAAFYSIVGLAAIFAAAVWPIVIMGTILEVAKLTVTVWLHEYWRQCRWIMKMYLVPAVIVLMIITSMGIFGFLSKAHIDQVIPTGDRSAQLALFDERIANERAVIDNSRSLIKQMDDTVNGIIAKGESREIKLRDGRIIVRSPAELALQVRRSQARDRDALTKTIEASQARIVAIQEERAPVAKEIRGLEAEVGPIKYIAALIYGDNPDTNLLERAVRWMIILLVAVFDPLAIMMLLAATESLKWHRESQRKDPDHDLIIPPEPDVVRVADPDPPRDPEPELEPMEPHVPPVDLPRPAYLDRGSNFDFKNLVPMVAAMPQPFPAVEPGADTTRVEDDVDDEAHELDVETDPRVKDAMREWKAANPRKTLKGERHRLAAGMIDHLPWMDLLADNRMPQSFFGSSFPTEPMRGDTCMRIDTVPNRLYKYNGDKWIEIDRQISDQFTYDDAYIDYVIQELESGRYDPDLLTDSERDRIELRLGRGSDE